MAAPADRQTQAEWLAELADDAWRQGQAALADGDCVTALRWLERGRRIAPEDATVALSLAIVLLRTGDAAAACALLQPLALAHDARETWLALAAARRQCGDEAGARLALATVLSRHTLPDDAHVEALAEQLAAAGDGWCAVRADRSIVVRARGPERPSLALDGHILSQHTRRLPERANVLAVTVAGRHLLGSPIAVAHAFRTEGFAAVSGGGLEGWAWHPGDPDTDPQVTVRPVAGGRGIRIVATDTDMLAPAPMTRPRRFVIPAGRLAGLDGALRVTGRDGRDLLGSPLDPAAERRLGAIPDGAAGPPANARPSPRRRVAVVVPVYRGVALTLDCLRSVFATVPRGTCVIVVDDATPEPELAHALDELSRSGRIKLLRNDANRGFPASANAGLREATGGPGRPDVVLLNSDVLLPDDWLQRLRAAVHAGADIGTATPLSNDATILSYPDPARANPAPDAAGLRRLARIAARANPETVVDIPTAVGFCMYVRRECLEATGLFREDLFAQGYGEENDFCLRAHNLGWRHVAVPGVYVAHLGSQSFGAARTHLVTRNLAILERLHPGYHALIAAFIARDPLEEARRRLDALRWQDGRTRGGAVILVTHDSGGGVERVIRARCDEIRRDGLRPIVLRPERARDDATRLYRPGLCVVGEGADGGFPNLRFTLPADLKKLARLLRADRPTSLEVHHLLGHDHSVTELAGLLGIPTDIHVHDYAWLCPRINLVGAHRRYCGEPTDTATCNTCVADTGSNLEETISAASLRARSAADLADARRITVPTADVRTRLRRYFPAIAPLVRPLEDDAELPPAVVGRIARLRRICVVGAIGTEKGYDVLLECARDAASRRLPLEFIVVGHTPDDRRLIDTGRVFVTGPYREDDAVALIRAQAATLAFLPSVWPETWCFALGLAWRAGLSAAAFDIGAPAERIRATGRGWLLPLGLPAGAVNDALLAIRSPAGDGSAESAVVSCYKQPTPRYTQTAIQEQRDRA